MDQDHYYPRYPSSVKSIKKKDSTSSSSSINVNPNDYRNSNSYQPHEGSFPSNRTLYVPERHQDYTSIHSRRLGSSRSPSREDRYSTSHSDSHSLSPPIFHQRRSHRSSKKKKDGSKPPVLTNIKVLTRPSSSSPSPSSFSSKLSTTSSESANVSSSSSSLSLSSSSSTSPSSSSQSQSQSQSQLSMSTTSLKQDTYGGIASTLNDLHLNKEEEEIDYIPGTSSISLIDKMGKLKLNDLKKLLQDQPSSLVIGVIGKPGLGKTFILSQFTEPDKIPPFSLSSSIDPSLPPKPFSVTAHLTPHRLILLDTQLFIPSKHSMSPTTLLRRSKSMSLDPMPPSVFAETLNVQLCAFLLSVTDICFVLLHQEKVSKEIAECIKKAKELVHRMPFAMQESNLIFIRNRVPVSDYSPIQYQSFLESLPTFFSNPSDSLLQLHTLLPSLLLSSLSTSPLSSTTITTTTTTNNNNNNNNTITNENYVNHFWLPDSDLDTTLLYPCSFQDALDYMKCQVLFLKKKKPTSEVDWIKLINQAWDFLKRSEFMIKTKS